MTNRNDLFYSIIFQELQQIIVYIIINPFYKKQEKLVD